ncbi:hypothetical protein ACH5RR_005348 [Cinchona calisaya]|uniref:RING-type domain-containing protein n=1 Tax=Cinchona calisaya TaxID=153742 RepID=A0ABD3AKW4_9GENT
MSPVTAILSLLLFISIPALIYAFFFAINCPPIPLTRPRRESTDELKKKESKHPEILVSGGVKYKKEAVHEQVYGSECPVCLSIFVEGDYVRQLHACKHSFHLVCINKWLSFHSSCPVCRASVPAPFGRCKRPATAGEDDFRQGLPDAASLV